MAKDPPPPQWSDQVGAHGRMRDMSWAEAQAAERARKMAEDPTYRPLQPFSTKKPMSDKLRQHCLSEKHIEMLARNRAAMKNRPVTVGVIKGFSGGGARKLLKQYKRQARETAEKIMEALVTKEIVNKDAAGNAALQFGMEVILLKDDNDRPLYSVGDRLKAASLVLQYTMVKPEVKATLKVETAEDWLMALANDAPAIEGNVIDVSEDEDETKP